MLWEGTTELLAAASQHAPMLVVLDDLHWADTASLQLLHHVIASTTAMNLTIACTYRDTDLTRGDALNKLLADLHREANVTRIALAGLGDLEVVELLGAAAGHDLDDAGVGLAHALRRETDGNPFFTGEVIRHLGETGGIVLGDDGRWTVADDLDEIGLPSSVRDVVGRRVERLGDETLRALSLAAVIGREFDISLLATLADIDQDSLFDLMDNAVAAAVLVESADGSRYRFAHALIQHTLYDDLTTPRRQRAHQRIAELLEATTVAADAGTLAELAHHWVAATRPADLDKALGYVRRAGDAARDALAPDDAIRWYQQALDLLARQSEPDQRQRAELLAVLGTVQGQASKPECHDTLLQAASLAEQLDDTDLLVQAALGFTLQETVGDNIARPIIRAALDRLGSEVTANRARLLVALAWTHDMSLEWEVCRDLCSRGRRHCPRARATMRLSWMSSGPSVGFIWRRPIAATNSSLTSKPRSGSPTGSATRCCVLASEGSCCGPGMSRPTSSAVDAVLAESEALTEIVGLPFQRSQHAEFVDWTAAPSREGRRRGDGQRTRTRTRHGRR